MGVDDMSYKRECCMMILEEYHRVQSMGVRVGMVWSKSRRALPAEYSLLITDEWAS
jgi:hypothetical protein